LVLPLFGACCCCCATLLQPAALRQILYCLAADNHSRLAHSHALEAPNHILPQLLLLLLADYASFLLALLLTMTMTFLSCRC
jgi:hypothetical protein